MTQTGIAQQLPLPFPGALFPPQLDWLCSPAQIEHTLLWLYYLNAWKKARQQLLYPDRQGLCQLQAIILEHAVKLGMVKATAYLDGTKRFPGEIDVERAAEEGARSLLAHVRNLCDEEFWPPFFPDGSTYYQRFIRPFYRRLTGQDFKMVADAKDALSQEQICDYLRAQLLQLIQRAHTTHRPISLRRLAALCIAPIDLLQVEDNRYHWLDSSECWDELESSDLRKLDTEGYSEIALRYVSPSAEFVFHLPYRTVEPFLLETWLAELRRVPGLSREGATFAGQSIKAEEGLSHPVLDIVHKLGADVSMLFPQKLQDKQDFLSTPRRRDMVWSTRSQEQIESEDTWGDPWDGLWMPPHSW